MGADCSLSRRAFCRGIAGGVGAITGGALTGCSSLSALLGEAPGLSTDWRERRQKYDFTIIGSGYGGAVMAARISRASVNASKSVCVLERGQEWPVGTFPETSAAFLRELRTPVLSPLGLYEFRAFDKLAVAQGCGLGGTSLVNCSVAAVPDVEVFEGDLWPEGITLEALQPYYEKAHRMLTPRPHPRASRFLKFQALERRAAEIGKQVEALEIAVNFDAVGVNDQGVWQELCVGCGNCVTGCNVGAKRTLVMNYLPAARANGAHVFTQTEVDWIERRPDGVWHVHGRRHELCGLQETFRLTTDNLVLAAGALGTTEILLRSQANGLSLSDTLGTGFSTNGNFLGIAYNSDYQTNILGFGRDPGNPWQRNAPGPTILGAIRYGPDRPLPHRFTVENGSFPMALVRQAAVLVRALDGVDTDYGDELTELGRQLQDVTGRPYADDGALNHTMLLLVMGHDSAGGRIRLDCAERAEVEWEDLGREAVFKTISEELHEHARALGARFISNPAWDFLDVRSPIIMHPLGGCRMCDSCEGGVIDEFGRAYAADGSLHRGLYVADGSVMPSALGVNPFLTIAALSERIAAHIIEPMES